MPGHVFADGDRIALRVPEQEDTDFLARNVNDPEIRASRTPQDPTGRDDVTQFVGGTMGRAGDSLALLACENDRQVGVVILNREKMGDRRYDRGELAYWITPDEQGNGYATEASRLLLDHAFDTLGLHKITARTFESNAGSGRVLEKLGFEQEGQFREEVYVDGDWEDYLRWGLLREDWQAD
jgi:RimJ/RimL family protein N-acetyltransferase